MASVPDATEYLFVGSYAFPPLVSTPNATEYLFTGATAFPALSSSAAATEYLFIGEVEFASLVSSSSASFYTFDKVNAAAGPAVGTGIVLYPISEDPNQRPTLRY
jgi:hypothetical protein